MISFGYLNDHLRKYEKDVETTFKSAAELLANPEKLETVIQDGTDRRDFGIAVKTYWHTLQETVKNMSSVEINVLTSESGSDSESTSDSQMKSEASISESSEMQEMRRLS